MTDRVGHQFGNYQLVKLLGQGGCAEVYLGKHRYLNSYAALKVLNARIPPGDEYKYLAEAQTLVDLRHPNIVRLLDFCIENGTLVLIMDHAPKGSLRQHYPQGRPIPLRTVVDFVAQIAIPLQYAHNHNVIHRDVKPENILLDANDHLLLSDFGLSLLTPSFEQLSTQDPVGTARYMAPEQLSGKPRFASDQYALAVMVYEWLCGEPPFRGSVWEIWHQHMYTAPPPFCRMSPELPPRLEKVVLRALAKNPQDRFVSIQAFAWALAQASQIETPPVDEHASQVTAPMQSIARSSLIAPHQAAALPRQNNQLAQTPTRMLAKDLPKRSPASALQHQNRVRMLGRLHRSYSNLMNQSLQGAAWLELGLADKPDAVQNVMSLLLRVKESTEQPLPSGISITQVYDEAEHELLILGEPGAGKSTLLLDLAQQLVIRAERDQTHPLPVILPLSSWAVKRPPLQDWIAEQLAEIYDIPRKLSIQWIQEGGILPLLDGLDEMEETARPACIAAINAYHRDQMAKLVVCSRTIEYEAAASHHRLALQGAVSVQPLTHEDIDAYLLRAGEPLIALRSALKKHAALQDLARTPLMLNILILTYQGTSMRDLSSRQSFLLQQVWDDYVQRMVIRKGNSKRYPLAQTRLWLGWLARQMRDHNQTVFYLEHLQPDWLGDRQRRIYTWRAIRLPAIFISALMGILDYSFFVAPDLPSLLRIGVLGGLLGELWYRSVSEKESHTNLRSNGQFSKRESQSQIRTARVRLLPLNASWYQQEYHHMWGKRLAISVCIGLIWGLSSYYGYTLSDWQTDGLSSGVVIGLGSLLLQYLIRVPFHPGTFPRNSAPRRWKQVVQFFRVAQGLPVLLVAVITGLSIGLSNALSAGLRLGLATGLGAGLQVGLGAGLGFGLLYALISLILGTQMGGVHPAERLRWTWRSLLRGLFNSRHLHTTVLFTCIAMIFTGLSLGLGYGLIFGPSIGLSNMQVGLGIGLNVGLSYWFLLGFFQGIAQERIEDQDRRVANQGTHRSFYNSVVMGIIGGTIIGIIGILSNELSVGLSHGLDYGLNFGLGRGASIGLNFGLLLGISGALLICALTGGLAIWRHYVIRLLLWRSHTFPRQAPQFLNDATTRFLLRRVGGGYSFTHRLLLDHFVDVETEPSYQSPLSSPVHN